MTAKRVQLLRIGIGQRFRWRGETWERVDRCRDRHGAYNAVLAGTDRRELFHPYRLFEIVDDED